MEGDEITDIVSANLNTLTTGSIVTTGTAILNIVTAGKLNVALDGNNPKQAVLV